MKKLSLYLALFGIIGATTAQHLPTYIPSNGLIAYYGFDGNANDESGHGYNGTVNGATLTSDRFGNPNSAYTFDGYSSTIITDSMNLSTKSLTISGWFKLNSYNYDGRRIVSQVWGGSGIFSTAVLGSGSPHPEKFESCFLEGASACVQTPSIIPLGQYANFTTICKNDSIFIFINGNRVVASAGNKTLDSANLELIIGGGGKWDFDGDIDDIGIWNRALTPNEVTNLYKGCVHETASLTLPSLICNNSPAKTLTPSITGGTFYGTGVVGNTFTPSAAKLGLNVIKYTYPNPISSCPDSTIFQTVVYDTTGNVCSKYIRETDTLIVNVKLATGISNVNDWNTLKIYPNPTNDVININTGNYNAMNTYTITITNSIGQTVFTNLINQAAFQININTFGAKGNYFVNIYDNKQSLVTTRTIVLQ